MVMVGDRGHDRCDNSNSTTDWQASFTFIANQIAAADRHNMTSILDSYILRGTNQPAFAAIFYGYFRIFCTGTYIPHRESGYVKSN